MHIENKLAKQ